MFDSSKLDLKTILADIDAGKLQLPEFQRSYVWNDSDVRSLIASVAKGYPVGALLTLQTGGDVKFKPRLIEGVPSRTSAPSELLLDGQQRMTSLKKVNVGGKKLDAFELVTAIYAAREFDLREDWDGDDAKKRRGRRRNIIGLQNRRDVVSELASTDFLQACTLVHTWYLREEKAKLGVVRKELPAVS
jgi:hypothetical protein